MASKDLNNDDWTEISNEQDDWEEVNDWEELPTNSPLPGTATGADTSEGIVPPTDINRPGKIALDPYSPELVQKLSKEYEVPAADLENWARHMGATYPEDNLAIKTGAKIDQLADNFTFNIGSWFAKKMQGEKGEAAYDRLRKHIKANQSAGETALDIGGTLLSPNMAGKGAAFRGGAVEGGILGVTNSDSGEELLTGGAGAAGGAVATKLTDATAGGLTQGTAFLLGRGDASKKYRADPQRYREGKDLSVEGIKERVDQPLNSLDTQITGKITDQKDASLAANYIRKKLEREKADKLEDLASQKRHADEQLRNTDVSDEAVDQLETALQAQNKKSGEIAGEYAQELEAAGVTIPTRDVIDFIKSGRQKLAQPTEGVILPSNKAGSYYDRVEADITAMQNKPQPFNVITGQPGSRATYELTPTTINQLIRNARKHAEELYTLPTGAIAPEGRRLADDTANYLRELLNKQTGTSAKRQQMAEATGLTADASKLLGRNPKQALRKAGADSDIKAVLERIEQSTGIRPDIAEYLRAQLAKKNKASTVDDYHTKRGQIIDDIVERQMQTENLPKQLQQDVVDLRQYEIPGISPTTSESQIRSFMQRSNKRPQVEVDRRMEAVEQLGGDERIRRDLDTLWVNHQFQGGDQAGSRLALTLGGVGEAAAGPIGRAVLQVGGAALDKGAGKATKFVLDAYLNTGRPMALRAHKLLAPVIADLTAQASQGDQVAEQKLKTYHDAIQKGPEYAMLTHKLLNK